MDKRRARAERLGSIIIGGDDGMGWGLVTGDMPRGHSDDMPSCGGEGKARRQDRLGGSSTFHELPLRSTRAAAGGEPAEHDRKVKLCHAMRCSVRVRGRWS